MAHRNVPQWVKSSLELGPVAAFFAAYLWLKDKMFLIGGTEYEGFIVVTAGFVPLMILATGVLWKLTGELNRMQVVTVVLVTVFGGLSVWLNDERFFKMKPTMIYLLFGGALSFGLMRGTNYLRSLMGTALPLNDEGWLILTRRITGFFFGLAVLNEVVWRLFSTETWVYFKTFGLTAALFLFFIAQSGLIQKYSTAEDD